MESDNNSNRYKNDNNNIGEGNKSYQQKKLCNNL